MGCPSGPRGTIHEPKEVAQALSRRRRSGVPALWLQTCCRMQNANHHQGPNQNQPWSLDFGSGALSDGRRLGSWRSSIIADTSLPDLRVVREFDFLIAARGCPAMISDNGTELTSVGGNRCRVLASRSLRANLLGSLGKESRQL